MFFIILRGNVDIYTEDQLMEEREKQEQTATKGRVQNKKRKSIDSQIDQILPIDYELETEDEKYKFQSRVMKQIKSNPIIEDMEKVKKVANVGIG